MARLAAIFNIIEEADRIDMRRNKIRRIKSREESDAIYNLSDTEFINSYRLSKDLFHQLCEDIEYLLPSRITRNSIPPKLKILCALSFYATGSYQRLVGQSTNVSFSQPSVSNSIHQVTDALNHPDILKKYIVFPQTQQERSHLKQRSFDKFGFPCVLACVDGTQMAMIRPSTNEERYYNRKRYHSNNVQIVSDSDLNILNVDATHGGACHDSFIWSHHSIKVHVQNLSENGEITYLLGDSGYAQRNYLMTPFADAAPGSPEEHYTKLHCAVRNSVERTIGILKGRWCCLLLHRVVHYEPDMVTKILNACCVLHNMCNRARVPSSFSPEDDIPVETNLVVTETFTAEGLQQGLQARQRLVVQLWQNRSSDLSHL